MVGTTTKDKDGKRITHYGLLENDDVRRWYENIRARSNLTAGVYLRGMGFYCKRMGTDPKRILEDARLIKPLQDQFLDFVRGMERDGKAGAYIARYKKVIHSWTRFNGIEFRSVANIRNESINERTQGETVPSQDELARILRHAGVREKVMISLIAYSGLRPRSISNDVGTDCLKLGDLPELKIETLTFEKIPARIRVRASLNKGQKHAYSTFLGNEGVTFLKEYLEFRAKGGEELSPESPIIQYDRNVNRQHSYVPTFYIERQIRGVFRDVGIDKRPYILRAYFATAMDIAEQKGLVSHPWRQFWMGHSWDMESRYSTNKELPMDVIEQMRSAYAGCLKYLETESKDIPEENFVKQLRESALMAIEAITGLTFSGDDREKLLGMTTEEFQEKLREITRDKRAMALNNGNKHKTVPERELETYLNSGWELVQIYPKGDKAVIKLPS